VNQTSHDVRLYGLNAPWGSRPSDTEDFLIRSTISLMRNLPSSDVRFEWLVTDNDISAKSVVIIPLELVNVTYPMGVQSSLVIACGFDARCARTTLRLEPTSSSLVQSTISTLDKFSGIKPEPEAAAAAIQFRKDHEISNPVTRPESFLRALNFNTSFNGSRSTVMTVSLAGLSKTTAQNRTHTMRMADQNIAFGSEKFSQYMLRAELLIGSATGTALADGMARYSYIMSPPLLEINSAAIKGFEYINLLNSTFHSHNMDANTAFGNKGKTVFCLIFNLRHCDMGTATVCTPRPGKV
jgi:hypothetical protein